MNFGLLYTNISLYLSLQSSQSVELTLLMFAQLLIKVTGINSSVMSFLFQNVTTGLCQKNNLTK